MKAALFDLDGTLIDSMWIWERILPDYLEKFDLVPSEEVKEKVTHMSLVQSSAYVQKEYHLPVSAKEIHQAWKDMVYHAYAETIALKPGAKEYLSKLKEQGVKIGLVTACDPVLCNACLENNGIEAFLDTIVYVDDVGKGKREPDIYIEALRRLETSAEDAILFEDIITGIRTAKKMGLKTVAVEDGTEEDCLLMKQEADLYIRDFYDLLREEKSI